MSIERLKKDEFRVIRVKEKAIRELIYETIIEKSKDLFKLPDINDVVFDFKLDLMNGDLICVAHKESDSQNNAFDFEPIEQEVEETTESLFGIDNYIVLKKCGENYYKLSL